MKILRQYLLLKRLHFIRISAMKIKFAFAAVILLLFNIRGVFGQNCINMYRLLQGVIMWSMCASKLNV